MKVLIIAMSLLFTSTSLALDDLAKALGAALQEAEQNHSSKQVALEVDTDKIEKAQFRKHQQPQVLELDASAVVDRADYSTKDMADEIEVEDSDDISKEINDN